MHILIENVWASKYERSGRMHNVEGQTENIHVCVCKSVVHFIFYIDWIIMTGVDKNRRYSKRKNKKKIFWWQSDWIHFYDHVIQVQYANDYAAENAFLGSHRINKWFWLQEIESLRMVLRAINDSNSSQLSRFNRSNVNATFDSHIQIYAHETGSMHTT